MSDRLKEKFKKQLHEVINSHDEKDPKCSFAAGMLLILSALKAKDGPTIPYQIAVMHAALREIGEEKGWGIKGNPIPPKNQTGPNVEPS